MAVFYPNESARHAAFLAWHREWMLFELEYHRGGSTSSGGQEAHRNDGEFVVPGDASYLSVILEVKNELTSGDPSYQLMRYVQVGKPENVTKMVGSLHTHVCFWSCVLLESLGQLYTMWQPLLALICALLLQSSHIRACQGGG